MISLSHLKKCLSVRGEVSVSGDKLSFYTDTRRYKHPAAFVAIPGARVNPLDVINDLLSQGCPLVVYQQDSQNEEKVKALRTQFPRTSFLPVTDSVTFLQELTHHHIVEWKSRSPRNSVFAISGSNGKTTHKEMLSHILKETLPGKVVATEKNNNNHLGVPLTILDVTEATEFLVLELGSNHPGEIKVLCDIAAPNAGITTNVGATHLEFFGDEKAVFDEEAYLYHAVKKITRDQGFFLINMDDQYLGQLHSTEGSVRYGQSPVARARITLLENGATIDDGKHFLKATNQAITGAHNKVNLITCLYIAHHFYPEHREKLIAAAATFSPTKNRSQWMVFEGSDVFLDAYNANPSSMKAALQGFKESVLSRGKNLGETCVVIGDMYELGDTTPRYHKEVGQFVKSLGLPEVHYVGRFANHYRDGHPEGKTWASVAEFKGEYRKNHLKRFPLHFIKGSRGLQLESLFDIT